MSMLKHLLFFFISIILPPIQPCPQISINGIMGKDWNWNVGGVLGYNKNKVTYVNVKAPAIFLHFDYPAAYPALPTDIHKWHYGKRLELERRWCAGIQ